MGTARDLSGVRSYTMRELNMHTADVIREINESGEQAVITRHGRHVAILVPVANEHVEAAVLRAVLDAAGAPALANTSGDERLWTIDQVSSELGFAIPK